MKGMEADIADLTQEIEQKAAATPGWTDAITRLCTIPGIDRVAAWTVLAETGLDMKVFGTADQLSSWAAMCPGQRETGGKRLSGKTRKGNVYLRRVLCQSAWAASHAKDCFLASLYRRIRSRRGHQKSIMAVAHRLLVIVFHMLDSGGNYRELGENYHGKLSQEKAARRHVAGLQRLGYYVTLEKAEAGPDSTPAPAPAPQSVSGAQTATKVSSVQPAMKETGQRRPGRPCKCAERKIPCGHRPAYGPPAEKNPEKLPMPKGQIPENAGVGPESFS